MKTTIIITIKNGKYYSTVNNEGCPGHTNARAGLTAYDAAARAARLMIRYAQTNPAGGDLMAPPEVLELVPPQLRSIQPSPPGEQKIGGL